MEPFEITFGSGRHARAVRARVDDSPASVARALNLSGPANVLLLSTGAGLMSTAARTRLVTLFNALGAALEGERVMVVDGGTNAGGMALMGQAFSRVGASVPHIGVLPAQAEVEPGGLRAEAFLEPHHSHFVLLEHDQWGSEIPLMSALASHLSVSAASATLLVNGGGIALQDIEQSVAVGRRVIVVAGSGRLADELALAVRSPKQVVRERVAHIAQSKLVTVFNLNRPPAQLIDLLRAQLFDQVTRETSGKNKEGNNDTPDSI